MKENYRFLLILFMNYELVILSRHRLQAHKCSHAGL